MKHLLTYILLFTVMIACAPTKQCIYNQSGHLTWGEPREEFAPEYTLTFNPWDKSSFKDTVHFGKQIWMTKNYDADTFQNGKKLTKVKSFEEWNKLVSEGKPAYCYYNFNDADSIMGKIYNSFVFKDSSQFLPKGWRLPTIDEWYILNKKIQNNSGLVELTGIDIDENYIHPHTSLGFYAFSWGSMNGQEFHEHDYFSWWASNYKRIEMSIDGDFHFDDDLQPTSNGYYIRLIKDTPIKPPILDSTKITQLTCCSATIACDTVLGIGTKIIEKGICWNDKPSPTIFEGTKTQFSYNFDNGGINVQLIDLDENKTYFVKTYAINETGISYGNELKFTTPNCKIVWGEGLYDIDSNYYRTVYVGGKEWMADNLLVTRNNKGEKIEKDTVTECGRLYTISDAYNMCPEGWRIPLNSEFVSLLNTDTIKGFFFNPSIGDCKFYYKNFYSETAHTNSPIWIIDDCYTSSDFTSCSCRSKSNLCISLETLRFFCFDKSSLQYIRCVKD